MEKTMQHEKLKLHSKYIIGILIGFLILTVAQSFFEVPELVERITFALTMTSMMLSMIAIFYTMFSNTAQLGQMLRLEKVQENIDKSAGNLRKLTEEFKENIDVLPKELSTISKGIETLHTKLNKSEADSVADTAKTEIKEDEDDITAMLQLFVKSTLGGIGFIYLACKHKQHHMKLRIEDAMKVYPGLEASVLSGFIAGVTSLGIVSIETEDKEITILRINPILYDNIDNWMEVLIETLKKNGHIQLNMTKDMKHRIDEVIKDRMEKAE